MRILGELQTEGSKTQRRSFVGAMAVEEGCFMHALRDEEHPLSWESLEEYSSQHDHKNGRAGKCGRIESWNVPQKAVP